MKMSDVVFTLAWIIAVARPARAVEYTVKFDRWPHAASLAGGFGDSNYNDPTSPMPRFVKWGSAWRYPQAVEGSKITNFARSRRTLTSLRIKVAAPTDSFLIDASSAGSLFTEVWVRKQGDKIVEAVFNGASVPYGGSLWNLVSPGTPDNPYDNFLGHWSDARIPISAGGEWVRLLPEERPARALAHTPWDRLKTAAPVAYRDIRVYGQSDDGKTIVFQSNGQLLVYRDATKELKLLGVTATIPLAINRITITLAGDAYVAEVWTDGIMTARIQLVEANLCDLP